jgi:hypothetical protein
MSTLTLKVGGRELPLAPLNYKAQKAQKENIRRLATGDFPDAYAVSDAMASLVHASLVRNHPELTLEEVEEALDQPTAEQLVNEVLLISFPRPAAGETAAESPSGSSTGTP